jgi:D-alanine--poly(phosphoribitol) ligase subunit 2
MIVHDWPAEIDAIFREVLGIELPSHDVDVIETGLLDSLALVTLLFEIEQRTGIEVPFETLDLDDLRTVESMAAAVGRLAEQAA